MIPDYVVMLWRQFWCKHMPKYTMRISSHGMIYRVYECTRCHKVSYEYVEDLEDVDELDIRSDAPY